MLHEVRGPAQQQHPRHIASFLRAAAVPISPSMPFHPPATSAETQGRPAGRSVLWGVVGPPPREAPDFFVFFLFFPGNMQSPLPLRAPASSLGTGARNSRGAWACASTSLCSIFFGKG